MTDIHSLSPEQEHACDRIDGFITGKERTITRNEMRIAGLAGTGKTCTLVAAVERHPYAAVAAPTGRAASNLRRKGIEQATTLHSLLMRPRTKTEWDVKSGTYVARLDGFDEKHDGVRGDVLFVDESSMLTNQLYETAKSRFRKIVLFGDHGQLGPVLGEGGVDPQLLADGKRDVTLETIFRQDANSPILDFAYGIRSGLKGFNPQPPALTLGNIRYTDIDRVVDLDADMVICYTNELRVKINKATRVMRGHSDELPEVGERVVCMKSERTFDVRNGEIYTVRSAKRYCHDVVTLVLVDDLGEARKVPVWTDGFNAVHNLQQAPNTPEPSARFDFAYCLTVHRAQGSEWKHVAVVDDLDAHYLRENRDTDKGGLRWRYTSITRASERLTYLVPRWSL